MPPYETAFYAPPYPAAPYGSAPYGSAPYGSAPYVAPVPPTPPASAGETAGQAPAPDAPNAPGTLAVIEAGQTTRRPVSLGELLIIGSDPGSSIILGDPRVSPRHASIERRGPGWLVRSLDVANPVQVLDDSGRAHPIEGELGLRSGELLIGGVQVLLYPPPH
jgi:pSer/pThr/pTyr-binding forkhead associated (FHA) protein